MAVALAVAATGMVDQARGAGYVVDADGFEEFALAALEGQQGWAATPGPGGSATVQSAVTRAGSKALAVERAAGADRRWGAPVNGYPTTRYVIIDWSMRVAPTGAADVYGPFFGMEAYDAELEAPGGGNTQLGLLGSLGVDATTGDVLYQIQDTAFLTETGVKTPLNVWNDYRIVLDFARDEYSGYFNELQLMTTGFADRSYNLDDFTDADIAAFAAGFDAGSMAQAGTAYFDDFRVWEPLPADFNFDGIVDGADLATWRGSAHADGADFLQWQRSVGSAVLAAGADAVAIPEPAAGPIAMALLVLAALPTGRKQPRTATSQSCSRAVHRPAAP